MFGVFFFLITGATQLFITLLPVVEKPRSVNLEPAFPSYRECMTVWRAARHVRQEGDARHKVSEAACAGVHGPAQPNLARPGTAQHSPGAGAGWRRPRLSRPAERSREAAAAGTAAGTTLPRPPPRWRRPPEAGERQERRRCRYAGAFSSGERGGGAPWARLRLWGAAGKGRPARRGSGCRAPAWPGAAMPARMGTGTAPASAPVPSARLRQPAGLRAAGKGRAAGGREGPGPARSARPGCRDPGPGCGRARGCPVGTAPRARRGDQKGLWVCWCLGLGSFFPSTDTDRTIAAAE